MNFRDCEIWLDAKAPRRSSDRRRAMVLAEVMVVVALSAILLSVVVTMLVGIRQWDRRFRDHGVHSDQMARLTDSIRTDVRRAADVSLPTGNTLMIAAPDKSQTRYELGADGCRRVIKSTADGPDERSTLFTIGPAESWGLDRKEAGRRPATIVWLNGPHSDKSSSDSVLLLVCAALGADLPAPDKSKATNDLKTGP